MALPHLKDKTNLLTPGAWEYERKDQIRLFPVVTGVPDSHYTHPKDK